MEIKIFLSFNYAIQDRIVKALLKAFE